MQNLWNQMKLSDKFSMKHMYMQMKDHGLEQVPWKRMFYGNAMRPRVLMTLWLTCHGKLPTKERFHQIRLLDTNMCYYCSNVETIDHLLFGCIELKTILKKVLAWIQVNLDPKYWHDEMKWITIHSKVKVVELISLGWVMQEQYMAYGDFTMIIVLEII